MLLVSYSALSEALSDGLSVNSTAPPQRGLVAGVDNEFNESYCSIRRSICNSEGYAAQTPGTGKSATTMQAIQCSIPLTTLLDGSDLCLVIDVHCTESHGVAFCPLKIVQ